MALDQLSKYWVLDVVGLPDIGTADLLGPIRLTFVQNPGVSFGFFRGEEQSFNRIEIDQTGIRVTVQRWNGSEFHSGDSEFFERHGDEWLLASGEKVEAAPTV